jgi:ribonuclease BN (tRNA processing enzyme)
MKSRTLVAPAIFVAGAFSSAHEGRRRFSMKRAPTLTALFLALTSAAIAQNVSGTWQAKDVAFAPWTFTLRAEGAKLTGTVSQGGSSTETTTTLTGATPIYDGALSGNKLTFKVDSPEGGRTITFSGVIAGDTIAFTREVKVQPGASPGMNGIYGASGATHFTATRASVSAAAAPPPTPSGNLQVVFLGTGTPNPDPDRSGPSLAIIAGPQGYIVDAGPGVVRRAVAAANRTQINALRPQALTFLFLTHLHSDHTLGYPDLIFTPAVVGRGKPLEVYGPKGTEEMTQHLLAAWKKDMDVRINGLEHGNANAYKVNVHEIAPGVIYKDANVAVKAFLVHHATWDQAFGYRFDGAGRSIVISGDASPSPGVVEACNGCDVLVHEVYCNQGGGAYYKAAHTSAAELAGIATQAKPKLLILYHQLFSGCNEAALLQQVQQAYSGPVVSAKDFDIY